MDTREKWFPVSTPCNRNGNGNLQTPSCHLESMKKKPNTLISHCCIRIRLHICSLWWWRRRRMTYRGNESLNASTVHSSKQQMNVLIASNATYKILVRNRTRLIMLLIWWMHVDAKMNARQEKSRIFTPCFSLSLSRNNELLSLLQIVFWSGFCWCRSRHFVPFKRKGNILCVCASRQSNESQVHNFKANSFHVCMIFFIAALYFSTFAVSSIQCIHCALLFAFFSGIFFSCSFAVWWIPKLISRVLGWLNVSVEKSIVPSMRCAKQRKLWTG